MSLKKYLDKIPQYMLSLLTGAYRSPREDIAEINLGNNPKTNIGDLFYTSGNLFQTFIKQLDRISEWTDIDYAEGKALDRLGENERVYRGVADDPLYRLMIRTKRLSNLPNGDIDGLISATANLYEIDPTYVTLNELFPAKVEIIIPEWVLPDDNYEIRDQMSKLIERLVGHGIGFIATYIETHNYDYDLFIGVMQTGSFERTYNFTNYSGIFNWIPYEKLEYDLDTSLTPKETIQTERITHITKGDVIYGE